MLRWAVSLETFVCAVSGISTLNLPVVLGLTSVILPCLFSVPRHVLAIVSLKELVSLLSIRVWMAAKPHAE